MTKRHQLLGHLPEKLICLENHQMRLEAATDQIVLPNKYVDRTIKALIQELHFENKDVKYVKKGLRNCTEYDIIATLVSVKNISTR